jgi:eukaryotic-like serine/threonine-protein kinase
MAEHRSERFGRYEVLSELGRGAMGVVYKARDPKINRLVAVKTISLIGQSEEEEREYRERFFREAEAAGRLSHPGIVTVFDVGEEPETRAPYIVMEYVGGQSLDRLLLSCGENRLPIATALEMARELAEALDCAHGQGVVHRDLKPANILLTGDGHPKISDFGVAKLNFANQTVGGRALGTPAFMSPEQLNGEPVDGRSDLFSLGVVLYTMVTGHRPFQGNSAITVSFKVVHRDPMPASLLNAALPPGLDYIISRAMAKDPSERYQRGMELVLDVQELREGREPWSMAKLPSAGRSLTRLGNEATRKSPAETNSGTEAKPGTRLFRRNQSVVGEVARLKNAFGSLMLVAMLALGCWGIVIEFRRLQHESAISNVDKSVAVVATAKPAAKPLEPTAIQTAISQQSAAASSSEPVKPGTTTKTEAQRPQIKTAQVQVHSTSSNASALKRPSSGVRVAVTRATLVIQVDHKFSEAHLSIYVDGQLAFDHTLEGTAKRKMVLFHQVEGHETHAMEIAAGKHELKARVSSDESGYDQSAKITADFLSGQENILRISFGKNGDINATLQ